MRRLTVGEFDTRLSARSAGRRPVQGIGGSSCSVGGTLRFPARRTQDRFIESLKYVADEPLAWFRRE